MSTGSLERTDLEGRDPQRELETTPEVSSFTSTVPHRRAPMRGRDGRFIGAPGTGPEQRGKEDLPADRYLEREMSWLQFNERVLQLAIDATVPLLERARFLAIFSSNLDEYFMVRVAGLKRRIATGLAIRTAAGLEPRDLLERIARVAHELMAQHAVVFQHEVRPALEAEGITIVRWDDLDEQEREPLHYFFADRGPPLPLHLRTVPQPRSPAAEPENGQRTLRASQGAAEPPALHPHQRP